MKRYYWPFLATVLALAAWRVAADIPATGVGVRWDIISVTNFNPGSTTIQTGGQASGMANDGSTLTLTGSGTFDLHEPDAVTGGGNWTLSDPKGNVTAKGAYQVTSSLRFTGSPGTEAPGTVDNIGKGTDFTAGLAFLRILYSDGSRGILVLSCRAPSGAPAPVPEGIAASKDAVFYNLETPKPNVDGNRTSFHLIPVPQAGP